MDIKDIVGDDYHGSEIILDSFVKMDSILNSDKYKRVFVSISAGADSDVVLDMVMRACEDKSKLVFGFFFTGLEYECSLSHLKKLEEKYGINIQIYRPETPIPLAVNKYGIPFLSKQVSEFLMRLQKHNFDFVNDGRKSYEDLVVKYPRCQSAVAWWSDINKCASFNVSYHSYLKDFIIENPPTFKISNKCCDLAKKKVAHRVYEEEGFDLYLTGIRRAEKGVRQVKYKSCFDSKDNKASHYRPIFWYSDEDRLEYEKMFNVHHSDLYEVRGYVRSGCCSCPYSQNYKFELEQTLKYEPKLYKAAINLFGPAYEYTEQYHKYREQKKKEKLEHSELSE